jgi:hypothetical protein
MILAATMIAGMVLPSAGAEHGVEPEANLYPATIREVCTTTSFGADIVETDCRYEALPAGRGNPALKGICTTYYGRRTCY